MLAELLKTTACYISVARQVLRCYLVASCERARGNAAIPANVRRQHVAMAAPGAVGRASCHKERPPLTRSYHTKASAIFSEDAVAVFQSSDAFCDQGYSYTHVIEIDHSGAYITRRLRHFVNLLGGRSR